MESQKYQSLVAAFEAWDVKISEFITFLLSSSSLRNSSLVHELRTSASVISFKFAINTAFPFTSAPTSDVALTSGCLITRVVSFKMSSTITYEIKHSMISRDAIYGNPAGFNLI
jgi:hypothetical protein